MTKSDRWKQRPCVTEYFDFKDDISRQAKKEGFVLSDKLMMQIEIQPPKSYSKKKTEAITGKPHDQKPDIDNIIKAVFDCLAKEDKTIHEIHVRKIWSTENKITIQNL